MPSQSVLEILIQAVDQSSAALQGASDNLKEIGEKALTTGAELGTMGAAITGVYVGVVDQAAKVQESQDGLKQAVVDAMAAAGNETGSYATQVKFLQDKIDGYKASIAQATATLDTHTGSVEKSAASHEKAAASIATDQINMAKYQAQLDLLTNAESLQGQSVDGLTGKLEAAASANVSLGFSLSDSTRSLTQAFTATKSVTDAIQVNQAAMDLARAKNIDLATATNQVILAMNGQGRALATYGIQIKDGLSGMEALQAVQGAVNGQSQAYAETLTGQLGVAMASFNKLLSDMGGTQLPLLTQLLEVVVKIIDAVDNFTQKHQKLTETVLVFVGVLGTLLTLMGSFLIILGTIAIAVATLGLPFLLLIGLVTVLATAIITNWTKIKDDIQEIFNAIASFISTTLASIQGEWNAVWTALAKFFSDIWTGMESSVSDAISFVRAQVQSFVSWAESILGPILGPINAIGTAAFNFGKSIGGALSSAANVIGVHDAIITPSGQVIQSDPADFLIATKTPGSLVGGGGGVTVNLNGGMYLSENAARMIADQVARLITRNIKVTNYAS